MFNSKKSQSIALNTVIFAAIALGVLFVTFLIFTNQSSGTSKTLQSCELKGGRCAESLGYKDQNDRPTCGGEYVVPLIISDPVCGESKLCCLKIG